jgi:hypothetical protein
MAGFLRPVKIHSPGKPYGVEDMIQPKKRELDAALESVIERIDSGSVTCEDFNKLISRTMIGESTPEAIRDRVRRRTITNPTDSHIDNETDPLKTLTMAARVQPKRQPVNQQSHGRARIAHAHSARTQEKTMAASLKEAKVPEKFQPALKFLAEHIGQPLTPEVMAEVPNRLYVKTLAGKLMSRPGVDRDWLYALTQKLG